MIVADIKSSKTRLRRTFLLIDSEHGPKTSDLSLLHHLRNSGIQHTIILSKIDKLLYPDPKPPSPQKLHNKLLRLHSIIDNLKQELEQPNAEILCVSAEKELPVEGMPRGGRLGVDAVRWAVLRACGLECDEKGNKREREVVVEDLETHGEREAKREAKVVKDLFVEEERDERVETWRPMA